MGINLSRRDFDCIASVYRLSSDGWPVRVKDVAMSMNVKPPTAVEFLDKLVAMELIEKGPSGYRLSKKGTSFMNEATRAHRLFETLFTQAGIPLEKACSISSSIEEHVDNDAMEKLCTHLSHPDSCPHGRPIPAGDQYD